MAFRAVHAEWGTVSAHLPDLGCGRDWETVWKVRPPVPLACDECGHRMHAKVSRHGLRFFAHAPGAPTCALAFETIAHHLLKLELANAARAAGVHAEMEVRGPDGAWRADVMASDPGGAWRMALEAQLAPITAADIKARTERMRADGVPSIWFSDRPRVPWLGTVPSVRLAGSGDSQGMVIDSALMKFDWGRWWPVDSVPLAQFLDWVFVGRIIPSRRRTGVPGLVWTAPRYIQAEAEHLAELERQSAHARQAQERRLDEIRQKNGTSRAAALSEATEAEQAARGTEAGARQRERAGRRLGVEQALTLLARKYRITATVGWSAGDPRYGGGVPLVNADGVPAAVLNPVPGLVRGKAFLLLAGTLLLFPARWRQDAFEATMTRARRKPLGGYRTDFIAERLCACAAPQLVVSINCRKYHAEPDETRDSNPAGGSAECQVCGREYADPWRLSAAGPGGGGP